MELDDLRHRWQQTAASTSTPLSPTALEQLLTTTAHSSVARLRRNAQWELGFTVAFLLGSCAWLFYTRSLEQRTMTIWLMVVCVVSITSYHRHMLKGIAGLSSSGATLHAHLTQQLADLRKVLVLSYRSVLWVLLITMGMMLFFAVRHSLAVYSGQRLLAQVGVLVLGYAIITLLAYFCIRALVRGVLQDLYGRYLDRLEAALRELQEAQ